MELNWIFLPVICPHLLKTRQPDFNLSINHSGISSICELIIITVKNVMMYRNSAAATPWYQRCWGNHQRPAESWSGLRVDCCSAGWTAAVYTVSALSSAPPPSPISPTGWRNQSISNNTNVSLKTLGLKHILALRSSICPAATNTFHLFWGLFAKINTSGCFGELLSLLVKWPNRRQHKQMQRQVAPSHFATFLFSDRFFIFHLCF